MCDHWSLTIYVAHICPMLKFQDGKKTLSLKNACPCFQMEFSHSITSQSLRDTGIQLVQVFQLKHQTSAEGGKPNTVRLYFHVRSDMASISKQTRKMRYPTVKLTDCGKTCTLTKLQTADPEKFKVKLAQSPKCRWFDDFAETVWLSGWPTGILEMLAHLIMGIADWYCAKGQVVEMGCHTPMLPTPVMAQPCLCLWAESQMGC